MDNYEKYLVGYILGDGMIKHYPGSGYEVKIVDRSRVYIEHIASIITGLYGIKPAIMKERGKKAWKIRIYSKGFYEYIKSRIKEAYSKEPDEYLISGLLDAEGDYTVSKKRLKFTNKDPGIITLMIRYLENKKIKHHVYTRRKGRYKWFTIEVYGKYILPLIVMLKTISS